MNSKQEKALNELIDQAQELKMGYEIMDWISVKDRLPKKYARVLVTDGNEVCIHYKQSGINLKMNVDMIFIVVESMMIVIFMKEK